jgi:hypothetical protein
MRRFQFLLYAFAMAAFAVSEASGKEIRVGRKDTVQVDGVKYLYLGPDVAKTHTVSITASGKAWLYAFPERAEGQPQPARKIITHDGGVYKTALTADTVIVLELLDEKAEPKILPKNYAIIDDDKDDFTITIRGVKYEVRVWLINGDSLITARSLGVVFASGQDQTRGNLLFDKPVQYKDLIVTFKFLHYGEYVESARAKRFFILEYEILDGAPVLRRSIAAAAPARSFMEGYNALGRRMIPAR